MRYEPREGPGNYSHPDFVPIYLDEQPASTRQAAETVCGGATNLACLYDYVATGSQSFALASGQTGDTAATQEAESSKKHGALRPQEPSRLIRDGEVEGSGFLCLTPTRYAVTTRMILH